jgi:hypothetical protein
MLRRAALISVAWLSVARAALAGPPAAASPSAATSRALIERPLLLPDGVLEVQALLAVATLGDSESYSAAPRLAIGRGRGELELGFSTVVADPDVDPDAEPARLQSAFIAARASRPGVAVGGELGTRRPNTIVEQYTLRGFVEHKRRTGARSALELSFASGIDHTATRVPVLPEPSPYVLVATGQIRAQIQIAPAIALEGRTALSMSGSIDVGIFTEESEDDTAFDLDYGARAVVAARPELDIVAGLDVPRYNHDVRLWTLGIVVRKLP